MTARDYTELLTSLPHLVDPFKYQAQSISLVQLKKRMNMLGFDDYKWIGDFRNLFYWGGIMLSADESQLVNKARRFVDEIPYPDIKEWLQWRMDVRTIIAAFRHRKNGEGAPGKGNWGFGRYVQHIEKNWTSPCFKLEGRFPFLPEINKHLSSGESYELEKILLTSIWRFYASRTPNNTHGFSMVVLYVMKWDLVDRWRQYDADKGAERFNALVSSCLPKTIDF
jgi:Protein of unknown function (DUF2764)